MTPQVAKEVNSIEIWNNIASYWDETVGDGNDMYAELVLPTVHELCMITPGDAVLDLGTGNGLVARALAAKGATVIGVDGSSNLLEKARERSRADKSQIIYEELDLVDSVAMDVFADRHTQAFDVVTLVMVVKSLSSIDSLAKMIRGLLKPGGRLVIVDLHPAFSKPGAHRVIEIVEDPQTGKQELRTSIKVSKYLDVEPVSSEAIRGQPTPLTIFHRPIKDMVEPFFRHGLAVDAIREPAFSSAPDFKNIQSYHNFPQIPMLLAIRLRLMSGSPGLEPT